MDSKLLLGMYKHMHFPKLNKSERSVPLYEDKCAQAIMIVLEQPTIMNEERSATTLIREDA